MADNFYAASTGSQPIPSTCSFTPPYPYAAALTPSPEVKTVVVRGAGVGKLCG
ncbi:MAG: hypothetical protein H7Z21_07845 [Hymenobacter sp.]|nr:hypothetical protein [Hymenobacter sp.]